MIRGVARTREQSLQHSSGPEGMPYLLYGSGNIEPVWVDARVALGDDGDLDSALFPKRFQGEVEKAIALSAAPGSTFRVGPMDPETAFFSRRPLWSRPQTRRAWSSLPG